MQVWAPVLLESGKWSQQVDGKLQQLLTELSTGLAAVVRRDDGGGIGGRLNAIHAMMQSSSFL